MSASSTDIARIVSHRRRLLSGYKHHETTGGKDYMYVFSALEINTYIYCILCGQIKSNYYYVSRK